MQMPFFTRFPAEPTGAFLTAHPRGFTVLDGPPEVRNFRYHYREEGGVQLASGLWEATPGAWRFRFLHQEFFHMLSGRLELTPADGETMLLGPGTAFAIEPGFAGTWRVLETMRKLYVTRYAES